jgi:bifunctional NMN adenylyltransferase/nudix hydrolase
MTAIIVGRFQVHELHEGHLDIIEQVRAKHKHVTIFLGVTATLTTRNNPLDFTSRKQMLLQHFPEITVLPMPDTPLDADWSKNLDARIKEVHPNSKIMLYGGRDSFIKSYSGHYPTMVLEQKLYRSGTDIRHAVSLEVLSSPDFRAGMIFAAYNQYPKIFATVDIAVFNEAKTAILLARKDYQTQFRFIGGFVDPTDESFEDAAKRETREEAGIEIKDLTYICNLKVDDWRYRREVDKVMTTLYACTLASGTPTPMDDIVELKWFSYASVQVEDIVPEHQGIFLRLLSSPSPSKGGEA